LLIVGIRQLIGSRLTSKQEHENVEYVMLQNTDDYDNDDEEPRPMPSNGHSKKKPFNGTSISMDQVEET
jgi:hypothetical protein